MDWPDPFAERSPPRPSLLVANVVRRPALVELDQLFADLEDDLPAQPQHEAVRAAPAPTVANTVRPPPPQYLDDLLGHMLADLDGAEREEEFAFRPAPNDAAPPAPEHDELAKLLEQLGNVRNEPAAAVAPVERQVPVVAATMSNPIIRPPEKTIMKMECV